MTKITRMLAGLLSLTARMLPAGRQQWAEAVQSEAGSVPAGWPQVRWLAGGVRLVAREANVVRKLMYWLGLGAVAGAAAWTVWLSWRAVPSPYYDPQAVTDRVRILTGFGALAVLPWIGRRHSWFGPVGSSVTARLVRVAGGAAMCGLGVSVLRMDRHLRPGAGIGPFSLPREIAGVALFGGAAAALRWASIRWPDIEAGELCMLGGMAGLVVLVLLPAQMLAILYAAGILCATSRRSPVTAVTLLAGTITGLASGLAYYGVVEALQNDDQAFLVIFVLVASSGLLALPAGAAAARLHPGTGDPQDVRTGRIRQGALAGAVAGAVGGLVLTMIGPVAVVMMVIGPLAGATAGALSGTIVADRRHARASAQGTSALMAGEAASG
jgi:hypothetical protein